MKNVLLKNVPEEDWSLFKSEAAAHNLRLAEFLSYVLGEHRRSAHTTSRWERILSWKSNRTEPEIKAHEEEIKKFRKTFSMER